MALFSPHRTGQILIQPSKVTRSCVDSKLALFGDFSAPSPPQWERPDTPVPSARCCSLLRSHPSSPVFVIRPSSARPPPFGLRHPPSATRHSSGGTRWTRVVQFPGLPVPFASLGHPIQRGPSFYCGKKDRHQRVTTELAARPAAERFLTTENTEQHGKEIRMCFHFCVLPCFPWLLPVLTIGTRGKK